MIHRYIMAGLLLVGPTTAAEASFIEAQNCFDRCLNQVRGYFRQVACLLDCELALAKCVVTLGGSQAYMPIVDPTGTSILLANTSPSGDFFEGATDISHLVVQALPRDEAATFPDTFDDSFLSPAWGDSITLYEGPLAGFVIDVPALPGTDFLLRTSTTDAINGNLVGLSVVAPIPEPSTFLTLSAAIAALGRARRRKLLQQRRGR